jgi:hypothetical protein
MVYMISVCVSEVDAVGLPENIVGEYEVATV